jgi:Glycosyltransferase family 87
MRLIARLFVFASSLFIVLYGVLPGFFKSDGYFVASYVAGRNFLHGMNAVSFYQFPLFQRLVDQSGLTNGLISHLLSPPSWIIPDSILAILPAPAARVLLAGLNIVAFVLLVHATAKIAGTSVRTTYLVFLSSSFALATNFQLGEPYIILALPFVLAIYAFSIGRLAACGAFLGLVFPFNPFSGIPAVLFLLSGKWRTFAYFVAAAAIILALTYVAVGHSAIVYYVQRILPAFLNGRIFNPFSDTYQTASSLLRRIFVYNSTLNPFPIINSTTAYQVASSLFKAAVVVPPAYFFYKGVSLRKYGDILVAASFPVIFLSPTLTAQQMIILAPATVVLAQSALDDGRRKTAVAFMVLYAMACLPTLSYLLNILGISNSPLDYDRFLILLVIYILYLVFQSRLVPREQLTARTVLSALIVVAVGVTVYFGDHSIVSSSSVPFKPAFPAKIAASLGFSPGFRAGKLVCITYDSASDNLQVPETVRDNPSGRDVYRFASDASGNSYAMEVVENGKDISLFRTRSAESRFEGRHVSVSQDGDYGAFMRNGIVYVLDLDPHFISHVDTLSLLPYRISRCSFNAGRNYELVFLIDSLNSSYSIGTYNLFNRRIATHTLPFEVRLVCSEGDDFYVTQDIADTTKVWKITGNGAPTDILSLRGNIYDLAMLNHSLFFSSDFGRGLNYPTVYEYTRSSAVP